MKNLLLKKILIMSRYVLYGFIIQCTALNILLASETGMAQRKSMNDIYITLNMTESSLADAFEALEEASGLRFAYNHLHIDLNTPVTLVSANRSLADILEDLSKDTGLKFKRINENIHVSKMQGRERRMVEEVIDFRQTQEVAGKVTGMATGEPLPGVNILEKGTSNGVVSDVEGNYRLTVSEGATLVFSSVGYETEEVEVGSRSVIDVALFEDVQQLQELVVVGYGTQKKADVTGSIAVMDAEKLNERPIARIDQAMIGQMSGVRVKQTSGIPGQGFSIQVRGTGSISANNQPLYVIDGFPLEVSEQTGSGGFQNGNPLTNLNPNDIESIQVLKDAAAGAIYGSRGSNGVVIITTKQGKVGKPQISFNTYVGWNETVKKLDVLSAEEWVDRHLEHINYFWVRDFGADGATSSQTNEERRALYNSLNPGNPVGADEYLVNYMYDDRWLEEGHPGLDYVDWQDLFFRKGLVQNYQISAQGGNEITRYYVSGDYLNQEGIALGVNYERFSARANVEVSPTDKLRFGLNISPSYSILQDPNVEGKDAITHIIVGMNPVVESETGPYLTNVGEYTRYAWGTSRVSPLAEAQNVDRGSKIFRTISTAFVEYEALPGLRLRSSLNFDIHSANNYRFTPSFVTRNRTASGSESGYTRINFVNENTANYSLSVGSHNFELLGGFSYSSFQFEDFSLSGTGFASDDVPTLNAATSISGSTGESKNVLISYFGRIQYDFNSRYLFSASVRRDGSSKFGNETKWGIFPSVSAGWRVSEETFMQDVGFFDDLKIRASWGLAGNNGVGDYAHISRLAYANYSYGGALANGQAPANFANPDLSWESSETLDVGLDMGILENRIYASFDYYTKRNTDLLLDIPVPTASGFSRALTNIGEVMNRGWEVELTTQNLVGEFNWSTNVNLSYNENEVLQLGPNNTPIFGGAWDITHNILEVGRPMYTLYVVQQDGLLTTEDIENGYPTYGTQEAGDPKYVDINDDGTIDADDRTYSGHPNPDYIWGINNTFNFRGFDLSVLVQGQWGGVIYSTFGRGMYRTGMGAIENTLGKTRDRVRWVEGQELTAEDVAGKERKSPSTFGRIKNTDWLYPNDYWRIRNITLGYDLGRLFNSDLISGARIYATAENWFGGDEYEGGFNPEAVNNEGDDYGAFPLSRSIIFGLNLRF